MGMESKWIWRDGDFVRYEDATLHFLTPGLHYGIGVFEGFASFMAEAAMKNSAKARLGTDAPKIGKVNTRCQWKTVNFECHARAQACK